jgi:acetyl esterase/lipase
MARIESGITYAKHDGGTLKGDLHSPETGRGHAIVIAAPGGAWLRGDKADLAHWGQLLADAGIALFSIDYRRSTSGKIFPQNARDVLAAVRFVEAQADALGVDGRRMGLLGASAGAHLAALVALAQNSPVLSGEEGGSSGSLPKIRALVGVYGIYDLAAHWRACQAAATSPKDEMADRMMGGPLTGAELAYRDASPASYVSTVDPRLEVLLIWGDEDVTVLPEQSIAFARALQNAGVTPETIAVPKAGHFWFSKEKDTQSGPNGEIAPRLVRFLQSALVTPS